MKENSKFSCPVSMKVTQEQYEQDLKQALFDLGYYVKDLNFSHPNYFMLCTNHGGVHRIITNLWDSTKSTHNRYFIDHYNPELFLALAGMREGDQIHVGEFMVSYGEHRNIGEFCKITSIDVPDDFSPGAFSSNYFKTHWRKATKEEIIDWFTKPLEEMPDLGSEYANDVVKGLLSEIENLKKENDELKGLTRIRKGFIEAVPVNPNDPYSLYKPSIHVDTYSKTDSPSLEDIEIHTRHYDSLTFPSDDCGTGYKESENKLSYELDWDFIEAMAKRMASNKDKYEPYNWTKPLHLQKLKEPLTRHFIEVMKGNYDEDGMENAHLFSIALNCMMINYQLKHNKTNE